MFRACKTPRKEVQLWQVEDSCAEIRLHRPPTRTPKQGLKEAAMPVVARGDLHLRASVCLGLKQQEVPRFWLVLLWILIVRPNLLPRLHVTGILPGASARVVHGRVGSHGGYLCRRRRDIQKYSNCIRNQTYLVRETY